MKSQLSGMFNFGEPQSPTRIQLIVTEAMVTFLNLTCVVKREAGVSSCLEE